MGCGCSKGAKVASTNNKTNNKSESNTNSIKATKAAAARRILRRRAR